ncbi:hypothetical protein GFB56_00335 [Ensifer sp. T173]|uniref:DUF3426 domain-containing protein n=1 Tax=Ensifer canadensis TaxID=555315 RepID=A0AAW4FAV9_9HYPH|nr:hypothetical protein [Ensifer canadensis]MBM3089267.1 hypothetical protein [Ensifer canadensis]UBI76809.1 hypothetical protein J3R84_06690 [Ensifer canadensis]
MTGEQMSLSDIASLWTALLATAGTLAGVWFYFRRGPRLTIEVVNPLDNRKSKKATDRLISIAVTNDGDVAANIYKLRLSTKKKSGTFRWTTVNQAVFDDATPWKPEHHLEPAKCKVYDLQFFTDWQPGERIEVEVHLRGVKAPFRAVA